MLSTINPLLIIKKIIKPKTLKKYIHQASSLLDNKYNVDAYLFNRSIFSKTPHTAPIACMANISNPSNLNLKIGVPINSDTTNEEILFIEKTLRFTAFAIAEHISLNIQCKSIGDETLERYRELSLLHRSISELNTSPKLKEVIRSLIKECQQSLPGQAGVFFLPHEEGFKTFSSYGDITHNKRNEILNSQLFKDILANQHGEIINFTDVDGRCDNICITGVRSIMISPILSPTGCEGVVAIISEEVNAFTAASLRNLQTLASVTGVSISNAYNFESIQALMSSLLKALAEAIDTRDPLTAGHSIRVAHLAAAFAHVISSDNTLFPELFFSDEQIREIFYSGLLHDIGKIGIKEEVLTKNSRISESTMKTIVLRIKLYDMYSSEDLSALIPELDRINHAMIPSKEDLELIENLAKTNLTIGSKSLPIIEKAEKDFLTIKYGNLTDEERAEIERHPAESKRILEHILFQDELSNLLQIIHQHHERIDGSGYPEGVKKDEIIFQSQILAIADIFDAITQARHYKPAVKTYEALKILTAESERGRLDQNLVTTFVKNYRSIKYIAENSQFDTHIPEYNSQNL